MRVLQTRTGRGLQASLLRVEGFQTCLDYIWLPAAMGFDVGFPDRPNMY